MLSMQSVSGEKMSKETIKGIGIIFMTAYSLVMFVVFFTAYFLNSDYSTMVYINKFGEAHIEAAMFSVTLPFIIYTFLRWWDYNDNTDDKRGKDNVVSQVRESDEDANRPEK